MLSLGVGASVPGNAQSRAKSSRVDGAPCPVAPRDPGSCSPSSIRWASCQAALGGWMKATDASPERAQGTDGSHLEPAFPRPSLFLCARPAPRETQALPSRSCDMPERPGKHERGARSSQWGGEASGKACVWEGAWAGARGCGEPGPQAGQERPGGRHSVTTSRPVTGVRGKGAEGPETPQGRSQLPAWAHPRPPCSLGLETRDSRPQPLQGPGWAARQDRPGCLPERGPHPPYHALCTWWTRVHPARAPQAAVSRFGDGRGASCRDLWTTAGGYLEEARHGASPTMSEGGGCPRGPCPGRATPLGPKVPKAMRTRVSGPRPPSKDQMHCGLLAAGAPSGQACALGAAWSAWHFGVRGVPIYRAPTVGPGLRLVLTTAAGKVTKAQRG